jgi:uncharacterized protein YggL (DUF469 family)
MYRSVAKFANLFVASAISFGAIALNLPKAEAIALIQKDLFFGRNIPGGGEVSEAEFDEFVDTEITPRFPNGLTISDADGQFLDSTNVVVTEQSKVITLFVEDTPESEAAIREISQAYLRQFQQESVLVVENSDELGVSFSVDEDVIDNDLIPEFIQANLFFGRNISGGGEVSEEQFQTFLDSVITPRFPDGLTLSDADGQFLDATGTLIEERSKVVTLLLEDSQANEAAINEIITTYLQQFQQESVLLVVNEEVGVSFSLGDDVIDNDLTPEFIQANLFFGRNIPSGGEVSEEQFQAFVDTIITPRFPAGLTIFDTDGQFLDSTGTLIEERSKVVTLLLEDTQDNETAISEIIAAYQQEFNQESVLLVVDEEVEVTFDSSDQTTVVEPGTVLALFITGIIGATVAKGSAV